MDERKDVWACLGQLGDTPMESKWQDIYMSKVSTFSQYKQWLGGELYTFLILFSLGNHLGELLEARWIQIWGFRFEAMRMEPHIRYHSRHYLLWQALIKEISFFLMSIMWVYQFLWERKCTFFFHIFCTIQVLAKYGVCAIHISLVHKSTPP